jgi:hypothetical protein
MMDGRQVLLKKGVGLISDSFAFFCISLYVSVYDAVTAFISILFSHIFKDGSRTYKKFFPLSRALAIFIFLDETNFQIVNIIMASGCSSSVSFFAHTVCSLLIYNKGDQKIR